MSSTQVQPRRAAPARPAPRAKQRRSLLHRLEPFVFLAPSLVLVAVLVAYPLGRAFWFSLNEANPFAGVVEFVGFDNFSAIFGGERFMTFVRNSLVWTIGAVTLQAVLGTLGALLLDQRFRFRGAVRALTMIPWATPSVLVALMWLWILDPNHGTLNEILDRLGVIGAPIEWLSDSSTALPTLIAVDVWQGVPFFAVMVLAALQAVPAELREASKLDGCGAFATFRYVVLPVIAPTIAITVVLRLIWTANYIDLPMIMTGGGPGTATTTLPLESYLTAYKTGDFGQGAAYAVVQALVLLALVVVYVRVVRKQEVVT